MRIAAAAEAGYGVCYGKTLPREGGALATSTSQDEGWGVCFPDVMSRILIVDDSPTIRKMVRASLRPLESFDFLEAANGLGAIEQIALR